MNFILNSLGVHIGKVTARKTLFRKSHTGALISLSLELHYKQRYHEF